MEINFVDNFLVPTEHQLVHEYCLKASYTYGEQDNPDTPVTGMIHNIPGHEFVHKLLHRRSLNTFDHLKSLQMYRMYVNCFAPHENPYFHVDGQGYTLLYYPHINWSIQEGGETQFYVDENIQGVLPVPNRMVIFDASILHRATTFRNSHRFTIAIKYQ